MTRKIEIGNIVFGGNAEPLVIPEIGINHEGDLAVAKLMVDAAERAGAKIVKHQTHIVEDEMCHAAKSIVPGNSQDSIYTIMSRCALSEEDEYELMQYVELKGMEFLSTPFSRAAVDRLERFGVKAYKIGSGEMNNYPLIHYIASLRKPVILSTGMNDIDAVRKAVQILEDCKTEFALMHTTNLYPTPTRLVRLGAMQQLMDTFPDVPIGLSDHTINNHACIAAMTLGAQIVERHFTDEMWREGPDVVCSMDELALQELVSAAHEIPQMIGGEKAAAIEEKVTIDFAFATVVTIKEIKKGEKFTRENLWVKRPGKGGIAAEKYESILGKCAKEDIPMDVQLSEQMIEE